MQVEKKKDGERGGSSTIPADTDQARELHDQRKRAGKRPINVDNAEHEDMELSPVLAPSTNVGSAMPENSPAKRPRGRPRGSGKLQRLAALAPSANVGSGMPESSSRKQPRGRPRGSGKLQVLAAFGGIFAESAGGNFTPHVLNVPEGADLSGALTSVFQSSTLRAVFVMSANGRVSNVVLRPPGTWANPIRFEGDFDILTLSGTSKLKQMASQTRPVGMLTVSLAKHGGEQIVGGVVAGPMIAVTSIRVFLGSFKQNIMKDYKNRNSMVIVPMRIPKTTDDDSEATLDNENCTTPTTAAVSKEADTVIINENRSSSPPASSQQGVGDDDHDEVAVQVWQPPKDDEEVNYTTPTTPILAPDYKQADAVIDENKTTILLASPLMSVGEYPLQVLDPPDDFENFTLPMTPLVAVDYKEAGDTVSNKIQSPSLQVLLSPSEQTTIPDTGAGPEYP